MQKVTKFFIHLLIFLILVSPVISLAQTTGGVSDLGDCFVANPTDYQFNHTGVTKDACEKSPPDGFGGTWTAWVSTDPNPPTDKKTDTTTGGTTTTKPNSNPYGPLVTCNEPGQCNWNELIAMVNRVINFVFVGMVVPIAAILFTYAGIKMVTAGASSEEARTTAKHIFTNVLLGLVIAAAAWVIVRMLLSILGWDGAWIGFNPY